MAYHILLVDDAPELRRMVGAGELGRVQMMTLNFGSFKEYDMQNRFFAPSLAGGALLDIGVYALSLARGFMESQPDRVLSQMRPAPTGVDEQAGILLMNRQGQMATLALSLHAKQPKRAMISCEKGYLEILEYPRADRAPSICTKQDNEFDGEPCDPLPPEVEVEFIPCRATW